MNLIVNMTLEWSDSEGEKHIDRVLEITPDRVVLFEISDPNAFPRFHPKSEILDAIERKYCTLLPPVSSPQLLRREESIPKHHRERRDLAWEIIKVIIEAPNYGTFDAEIRGKIIREAVARTGKSKKTIYKYLRKYWRYGCAKNALLPCFHKCGGKGKLRTPGEKKRGRQNQTRRAMGVQDGINIGPEEKDKIRQGIKRFHDNPRLRGKYTLEEAYNRTLGDFFHIRYDLIDDLMVPVLPPVNELPSFRQFKYVYYKDRDLSITLIARKGQRRFNLNRRAVIGDSSNPDIS